MESDWPKAIEFVLKMEGEYTMDPNDPGGETKYGISKKAFPNLDIKNLTVEDAKKIYRIEYWDACSCDDLPTAFAISAFDMAVNQGVTKAKRTLQMALGVDVDGIIGPVTMAVAAGADRYRVKKYLALRLAEYARTMSDNHKLLGYALNWSYRVLSLADLVLINAGADA